MRLLLFLFLPALLAVAAFGTRIGGGDDKSDDAPNDGTPEGGSRGDQVVRDGTTLDIGNGATGTVFVTRQADQITVDVDHPGYSTDGAYVDWDGGTGQPPLLVRGGVGDDTLHLSGSGYAASGGMGRDTIYLQGLHDAVVQGGPGDTIYGQGVADLLPGEKPPFIELVGAATFLGGSAPDLVVLRGDGALSNGGGGDDTMRAFDGASTLIGGAANDTLSGGWGDSFTGGDGEDDLVLTFDPTPDGTGAVITDFQPGVDSLKIQFDSWGDTLPNATLDGRITATHSPEGWLEIRGDGLLLVTLQGYSDARIGSALDDYSGPFKALEGSPLAKGDYDILVTSFFKTVT